VQTKSVIPSVGRFKWLPIVALLSGVFTEVHAQDFFRNIGTSRSSGGIGPGISTSDYSYTNAAPSEMHRLTPVDTEDNDKYNFALGPLRFGIAVGVGLSLLMIVVLVNVARKRNINVPDLSPAPASVVVQVATTPPGASIRVNGEARCTSDCTLTLAPGSYQVTAFLDGYEPAASGVNLVAGTETPLGIVPAGTGNDIARCVCVSPRLARAHPRSASRTAAVRSSAAESARTVST